jgi:FkbM family methyltransferase
VPILNTLQRILEPLPIRGKSRLAIAVLSRLGECEVQCHPLRGVTVFLQPDKWIEQLMWAGSYERELVNLFKRVLKPGMTVLDLGANIGYFSVLAAGLVGNTGQVHAFEPDATCFARLKKNLSAFPWAQAHSIAVGDQPGMARFHYSQKGSETGWGSLLFGKDNASTQETLVPVMSLDAWACEQAIRRVDFIKMDIEGGEYRALKGAEALLYQHRPVIVAELNEVCLRRDHREPTDVLSLLRAAGYNRFSFNDGVLGIPQDRGNQIGALRAFARRPL